MRSVASSAGVSDSSVAEVALKRLFASGNDKEIVMTLITEGAGARRHTRKTWLKAFYAALRDLIPPRSRTGRTGNEFMHYEVLASAEREGHPESIVIHTLEENLPTTGAVTCKSWRFAFTLDSSPMEAAKSVLSWIRSNPLTVAGRERA
jgi:hypothetical protein